MPGIWGVFSTNVNLEIDLTPAFYFEKHSTFIKNLAEFSGAKFGRLSINKFIGDKVFEQISHNLICIEGLILNLQYLSPQIKKKNTAEIILDLYNKYDWKFLEQIRGTFSGFIYSATTGDLLVFTDQLASKPIYYFFDKDSGTFIFASELKAVISGMKTLGFTPHLSTTGSYSLLTLGYMIGNTTLVEEIKKLPPGNILQYQKGKLVLREYYKLSSTPYIVGDENEIIGELDRLFTDAIKSEYNKDLDYGYKHLVTLSGGLDSRMSLAYANKLGYKDITCFTFSESDYLDEKIAKQICRDKHFGFIFYALDNGEYLIKDIDDIISSNSGLVLYSGAAHLFHAIHKIDFYDFGLVHTGMIGDLILGSYLLDKRHDSVNDDMLNKVTYSKMLLDEFKKLAVKDYMHYENDELFAFYERCINGVFNGYRMIEQHTEFASPFLFVDFLDFAMKIHPKLRYKEAIYLKWINKCIPEFAKYKWEKYAISPRYPLSYMEIYHKVREGFIILTKGFNQKYTSMVPTEYWWVNNKNLREKTELIFQNNINILNRHSELSINITHLYTYGSFFEKTQAITLLKAINFLGIE